jgi:hypothetical protein
MQGWYIAASAVIGLGCLGLGLDFARHSNRTFALLFALLGVERLFDMTATAGVVQPGGVMLTGFVVSGVGLAIVLAVVVGRVVVGRGLYVLMRHRKASLERGGS